MPWWFIAGHGAKAVAKKYGKKRARSWAARTTSKFQKRFPTKQVRPYVSPPMLPMTSRFNIYGQSRRGRSSPSYQQNGSPPWAQRKRRSTHSSYTPRNEVSRRARGQGRRRRGIASWAPYCRIHKTKHWCWNTRKR